MDDDDVQNLIGNISLHYDIDIEYLKISIKQSRGYWAQDIDTVWIPLKELKQALDNVKE